MTNGAGLIALAGEGSVAEVLGAPIRLISLGTDTAGLMDVLEAALPAGKSLRRQRSRLASRTSAERFVEALSQLAPQRADNSAMQLGDIGVY